MARRTGERLLLLLAGTGIAALWLLVRGFDAAGAQVLPPVIEVDGIAVVPGPPTLVEVDTGDLDVVAVAIGEPAEQFVGLLEADVGGVEVDAILVSDSTPPSTSFSGNADVDLGGLEVSALLGARSTGTSSSFFARAGVGTGDVDFFVSLVQVCSDGEVTTSTSFGSGGGGVGTAAAAGAAEAAPDGPATAQAAASCPAFPTVPPSEPGPEPEPEPQPEPEPGGGASVPEEPAPAPDDGAGSVPTAVAEPPPAVALPVDAGAPSGPAPAPTADAPAPPAATAAPAPTPPPPAVAPVVGPAAGPAEVTLAVATLEPTAPALAADVAAPTAVVAAPPSDVPAAVGPPAAGESPGTQSAAPAPGSPGPSLEPGRITLSAVTRVGLLRVGPAGVGLTLTGTGFPPRRDRAARSFAASRSLAQLTTDCDTVYFFFDGVRIGTARPDAAGNVRRTGLSVPGGADPGIHAVTASCASGGAPVLAATEFAVTDADPHRSAFATSLHRPDHVEFGFDSLLLSALGALGLLLLIAFPAELFNTTLEEHYDEVRSWIGLGPRSATAGTGASNVAVFVLFVALSGPLWFSMQGSSGLDTTTALAALGMSLSTAVVVLSSDLPTFAHLRRRYGERADVVALPGSLLIAVCCVLLSRAVHFEPGYFYGLVGGLAFARRLRRDTTGRLAATSVLAMVGLSVVAWLALMPVARIADRPDAGWWPILVENFLGGIFWAALDSLVIALLPLRFLTGSKIVAWSRAAWAVLYAATLFAFIHILLRPGTGYVSDTSRSPTVVVVGLFVAFAIFSFAFWGYFRFRSPRPTPSTSVPA